MNLESNQTRKTIWGEKLIKSSGNNVVAPLLDSVGHQGWTMRFAKIPRRIGSSVPQRMRFANATAAMQLGDGLMVAVAGHIWRPGT